MKNTSIAHSVLVLLLCFFAVLSVHGQVAINKTGASAHPSAIMDLSSDNSGLLAPRMTYANRVALTSTAIPAAEGMLVYQTDVSGSFTEGFYQLANDGTTWRKLNSLQQYRANILMQSPGAPLLLSGSLPGATLTTVGPGAMRVDIPGLGADAVVLINGEFNAVGTPPIPPADYCANSHSGNCQTANQHNQQAMVTIPVGRILQSANFEPGGLGVYLSHAPGAATCNVGTTDYQFHNNTVSLGNPLFTSFGQTNSWNGTFSAFGYVGYDVSSLVAGTTFDLTLTGNHHGSTQTAVSAFIDWNQDGDFFHVVAGQSEVVVKTPSRTWPFAGYANANAASTTGNVWQVTVPAAAVNGKTTMRIVASTIPSNTNPCVVFGNGSTRDYAFEISGGVAPTYPGETRTCNVYAQDASGFQVRCFKSRNAEPVNDRFFLLINPQQ